MQGPIEVNILSLMVQRRPEAPCGEVRVSHFEGSKVTEERLPVERVCYSTTDPHSLEHIQKILRKHGIHYLVHNSGDPLSQLTHDRRTVEWYIAMPRDFWGVVWPYRETQLKEARDRGIDTGYANGMKVGKATEHDIWQHKLNCYRHLNVFKRVWLAVKNEVLK